jgi:hypothetical protein
MKGCVTRAARAIVSAAVLAAVAAPAASAALAPPVTLSASGVTATTAVLHAAIPTGGLPGTWVFQVGTSTAYTATTPGMGITAGGASTVVAASSALFGLKPNTTYHFRIVVQLVYYLPITVSPYVKYYVLPEFGADVTFTTSKIGTLVLVHRKVAEKKHKASIALRCASVANCAGKLSATAKQGHMSVTCISGTSFSIAAGKTKSVSVKVSSACDALFKHHQLKVTLTTKNTSGQPNLKKTLTLVS